MSGVWQSLVVLVVVVAMAGGIDIPKVYTKVSFARNHIKSIAADTFSPSSSLVSLDISENDLESVPGRPFAELYILSSLNLRSNLISSVDPEAFGGLQNLTQLDISYNRITSLPKEIFEELTSLQELNIGFNPLEKLDEGLLQHTPDLRRLDLSKLHLKSIPANFFVANLTKLETVSLAYNQLKVVPSRTLHGLSSSLLNLDLSGNLFTSLSAYSFGGLSNLRTLTLEQMLRLTRIDAYAFGDLMRLEKIVFRYIPWIEKVDRRVS
ncbi:Leucine-rich repeat-containing protein 15 [Portunus trituberculatus]|uniref:Leucine-rich repeat-containing protein 15 n=1 Tax=Portunus trituberculatus TaxID=210409 RepID=A0A5B7F767_PORTR|nr:Leucine-rich repeat-containing protein 15 [Portunus trituberculatus]